MIDPTIECIDKIDDVILESEINVLISLMDSYEKMDMIMENGGYCGTAETSIFSESAKSKNVKPDGNVKKQSGIIRLITRIKEMIIRFVAKIAGLLGFTKKRDELEKLAKSVDNNQRSIGEKVLDTAGKTIEFVKDHPVITAVGAASAFIGVDIISEKRYDKKYKEYHKKYVGLYNEALKELGGYADIFSEYVKPDESECKIILSMRFNHDVLISFVERRIEYFIYDGYLSNANNSLKKIINSVKRDPKGHAKDLFESKEYKHLKHWAITENIMDSPSARFDHNIQEFDNVKSFNEACHLIRELGSTVANGLKQMTLLLEICQYAYDNGENINKDEISKDLTLICKNIQSVVKWLNETIPLTIRGLDVVEKNCDRFFKKFEELLYGTDFIDKNLPNEPFTRKIKKYVLD